MKNDRGNNEYKYCNGNAEKCEDPKEEIMTGGSNGSINMELSSYRAAKLPISLTVIGMIGGILSSHNSIRHPLSVKLPLLDSYLQMITILLLYILAALVWGPKFMKDRKPFQTKSVMVIYNIFQVILSSYLFYKFGVNGWFSKYNWICQPVIKNDPQEMEMATNCYLFFISKIIDFTDTFFFIVNKKWSHITILHIVHHSNIYATCWFGMRTTPSGHLTLVGFLNSGVHVLMYTYYLLSALGPKVKPYLWWKKYLTTIQLLQFVVIFLHSTQGVLFGCDIYIGMARISMFYAGIFFVLFIDFFRKVYSIKNKKMEQKQNLKNEYESLSQNGKTCTNGYTYSLPSIISRNDKHA